MKNPEDANEIREMPSVRISSSYQVVPGDRIPGIVVVAAAPAVPPTRRHPLARHALRASGQEVGQQDRMSRTDLPLPLKTLVEVAEMLRDRLITSTELTRLVFHIHR